MNPIPARLEHLEQFPPPKLALSENRITLRGKGIVYGSFEVFNEGEGKLVGSITSMADFLSFSPHHFEGKKIKIEYALDLVEQSGDIFTGAVITTNGGEKIIDFNITVNPSDILVKDGVVMADLDDYMGFVKNRPLVARTLFSRPDFMMWLTNMGYGSMDMYEKFAKDPNKERAVDNFLVFNGNKYKAKILPDVKEMAHAIGEWEDVVTGSIALRRTTWGYAEATLEVAGDVKWLSLSKNKVTSADFDAENMAQVHYIITPDQLVGRDVAQVVIKGCDEHVVHIRCTQAPPFHARLDKQSFFFEDRGKLFITNNTGRDLMMDVTCESFIKFDAKRYLISKTAQIEFDIKYSSFKAASLAFKKQLFYRTFIHLAAINVDKPYGWRLPISLWSL